MPVMVSRSPSRYEGRETRAIVGLPKSDCAIGLYPLRPDRAPSRTRFVTNIGWLCPKIKAPAPKFAATGAENRRKTQTQPRLLASALGAYNRGKQGIGGSLP
jgi:hypothetical protein